MPIYCDNKTAISISKNPTLHSRAKHIDIKHHFLRDHVQKETMELQFEPLQLCLSTHVLHFLKIMSNTLMIFVTFFFYDFNVIESKKNYIVHRFHRVTPQNNSTKSKKNYDLALATMVKYPCSAFL